MPLFICILNLHVTLNKRKPYRSFLVAPPIQFQMKTGELLWRHRYIGRWLLWHHLYHNCKKYPLSPLKPRGLALLSLHVLYHWGSGNSVHPSFTQFQSLNWRKSTFNCSRVPILFQTLTADAWPIVTSSTHGPAVGYCDTSQWSIVPTGIYGRMMLRSTRVKRILCLLSSSFSDPHVSTRGIASTDYSN